MGYTHYFKTKEGLEGCKIPNEKWDVFRNHANHLIKQGVELGIIEEVKESDDMIMFNGIGEQSHEDFYLNRTLGDFAFCKTAHKPYDKYVVGVLLCVEMYLGDYIKITSDGDWPKVKIDYLKNHPRPLDNTGASTLLHELELSVSDAIMDMERGRVNWDMLGDFFTDYLVESYLNMPSNMWGDFANPNLEFSHDRAKFYQLMNVQFEHIDEVEKDVERYDAGSVEEWESPPTGVIEEGHVVIFRVNKYRKKAFEKLLQYWGYDEGVDFYEIDLKTKQYIN